MRTIRPNGQDPDDWEWDEELDEQPERHPRHDRTERPPATQQARRRQQDKEWGRRMFRFHKERRRENGKP